MGAGAGCTIEVKDCIVKSVNGFDLPGATLNVGEWNDSLTLDCNVSIEGTINVSSYYDGTGDIEEVAMTVNQVTIYLGIGRNYNNEIFTAEAISRFETQFGRDIDELYEELLPIITVDDISPAFIEDVLSGTISGCNYNGTGRFGGGWIGVKFAGAFEITDIDSSNGNDDITGYACSVDEGFVIDYIDKAKYGDNIEYTAFYNGDILDTYNDLDEAISALKSEILEDISAADPYDCYVERNYYFLRNGSVDNYEYESDWYNSEVEYCADSDSDFDFEALADLSSEIDDDFDVGIDEGFDI